MSFLSLPRLLLAVAFAALPLLPVHAAGMEGQPAPAVTLPDANGAARTLAGIAAGRPTVVLFWASWCPYCKALMPHLQSMLDEYGSEHIEVVAINIWEDSDDDWKAVMLDNGYDFRNLLKGDAIAPQWQVRGTPGLFVLAADGSVVFDRNAHQFNPLRRNVAGIAAGQSNAAKAARAAPLWAAAVRQVLDAELAKPIPAANPTP